MPKPSKVKHSRHQKENVATKKRNHVYSEEEAAAVISNPIAYDVDAETGRDRYWGFVRDGTARVVTSVTDSAAYSIQRIVTMFKDKPPKK